MSTSTSTTTSASTAPAGGPVDRVDAVDAVETRSLRSAGVPAHALRTYLTQFNERFEDDAQRVTTIRPLVRALVVLERQVHVQLQRVHDVSTLAPPPPKCASASSNGDSSGGESHDCDRLRLVAQDPTLLADVHERLGATCASIRSAVPPPLWLQHHGLWREVTQALVAHLCFQHWLLERELPTIERIRELFDRPAMSKPASATTTSETSVSAALWSAQDIAAYPFVDVEDFLHGASQLPRELSRLSINAVRAGNYDLPQRISTFVVDLYAALRVLNLRNDTLRRKFDSIKYDVEKIESVLYDLRVHHLQTTAATSADPAHREQQQHQQEQHQQQQD